MTVETFSLTWRQWFALALIADLCLLTAFMLLSSKQEMPLNKTGAADSIDQPLDRFAADIHAFEQQDKDHPPPPGGTVFIGSSTFSLAAPMLVQYFADFNPIVRAFGGSTIPEINHYIEQTVLKYQPAKIVFYAGPNDIADGHSGMRVLQDFAKFASLVSARLPHTEIIFISMSVAPSRLQWHEQYAEGNRLIQQLAEQISFIKYVDVTHVMYDAEGKLHTDWFLEDQLHMNHLGYEAWLPIILHALRSQSA
jgi:hypothetical protein